MKPRVLIPEPIATCGLDLLKAECDCVIPFEDVELKDEPLSGPRIKQLLEEVEAVTVRLFTVSAADLERAKSLKVIVKHGVGVDSIDCEAATRCGIPVAYTPGAIANAAAEHVLTLMLALARKIVPADASVRDGSFDRSKFRGVELLGKTLGVIGLGRIGSRVVEKATRGLEMKVRAYDPLVTRETYDGPAVLEDSVEAVLETADFITLHVPLTPKTQHLINSRTLEILKPSCSIINTSRGAVIDEEALAEALRSGRIAGAALDVFETEPLSTDHPLLSAPNALLTPHIASSTVESLDCMAMDTARAVLDGLTGKRPEHVVNPEVYGK